MSEHAVNGNGSGHGTIARSSSSAQLLPPELWQHVLEVCHPSDLQHTALALSRAIPNAGITLKVRQCHAASASAICVEVRGSELIPALLPVLAEPLS